MPGSVFEYILAEDSCIALLHATMVEIISGQYSYAFYCMQNKWDQNCNYIQWMQHEVDYNWNK